VYLATEIPSDEFGPAKQDHGFQVSDSSPVAKSARDQSGHAGLETGDQVPSDGMAGGGQRQFANLLTFVKEKVRRAHIASRLGISTITLKTCLRQIASKLNDFGRSIESC